MQPLKQIVRVCSDAALLVEFFIVSNLAFLAVDIFVAHSMNGFAHWAEWIPFVFSLVAPVLYATAVMVVRLSWPRLPFNSRGMTVRVRVGRLICMLIGACSIAVGIAGLLFHLDSLFFQQQTLRNLVYAAPFVAPLAYSGIGFLILLNQMVPTESDEWARWVVLLALGGWVGNFVLSLTDHAQNAFFYWVEWIPVVASALAIGALLVAISDYRNRAFLRLCMGLMLVEIIVGVAGWILHVRAIAHSPMDTVWERIVYSAPAFAPLLFADLAPLALLGLVKLDANARHMSLNHANSL